MTRSRTFLPGLAALMLALLFCAASASAQSDSGIAGVVKDASGAVIPGVTVEASSPALIEKVRTVVTDGEGQYKILGLRPGVYTVTFTLQGFSTVRREGIELTASFTAPVSVDLKAGSLEETITVTGASPVVDVQSSVQGRLLSQQIMDEIPTAKTLHQMTQLIPGAVIPLVNQDVGGASGEVTVWGVSIYGSRSNDMTLEIDGLRYNGMTQSGGTGRSVHLNAGAAQEVSLETSGITAETEMGGIRTNIIPKDGGNQFSFYFYTANTGEALYSDNLTDDLKARGVTSTNGVKRVWDVNPAGGGPIVKDKLWFFAGGRAWGSHGTLANTYDDTDKVDWVYIPDFDNPTVKEIWAGDQSLRLTWQATKKNKFTGFYDNGQYCDCQDSLGPTAVVDAARKRPYRPNHVTQFSWVAPLTNKLLIEAGFAAVNVNFISTRQDWIPTDRIAAVETTTGIKFRASSFLPGQGYSPRSHAIQKNWRTALSYVTGSHAFKGGVQMMFGQRRRTEDTNGSMVYSLTNGRPIRVNLLASPLHFTDDLNYDLGIFAQDQWTVKRLTLNMGVRYDALNAEVPPQHQPETAYLPARDYDGVKNVPSWKDLSPRLGFAYDLFGDGKTAIKGSLGRYMVGVIVDIANAVNPARTTVTSAVRNWTDPDGDFFPDCDLANPLLNGECGPISSANFGRDVVNTTYDPEVLTGSNKRQDNWEASLGFQRELTPGLMAAFAYHRRWYSNFLVTDFTQRTPADYDHYCVTAPTDSRLPSDVSGQQICGLYDVSVAKSTLTQGLVTFNSNFGERTEVFNGVDLVVNGRMQNGLFMSGGMSTGRTEADNCVVVDSPQLHFCDVKPPFFQPQWKILASYPLPWYGLQVSTTYQNIAGPPITANNQFTNAQVAPTLGRNLSSCGTAATCNGTVTIPIIEPSTLYEDRLQQIDVRASKKFTMGRVRSQVNFDAYNVFNAASVLAINTTFGPQWRQPTAVLSGRLLKFGVQFDF